MTPKTWREVQEEQRKQERGRRRNRVAALTQKVKKVIKHNEERDRR